MASHRPPIRESLPRARMPRQESYHPSHQPYQTRRPPQATLVINRNPSYQTMDEVFVRVRGLKPNENTLTVHQSFKGHGNIKFIELFADRSGNPDGSAKIKFSPPPREPFWEVYRDQHPMTNPDGQRYNVSVFLVEDKRPSRGFKSPVCDRRYEPKMKLLAEELHFGIMMDSKSMMSLHKVEAKVNHELAFLVDLNSHRITTTFSVTFVDPRPPGTTVLEGQDPIGMFNRTNKYMFQIPFGQLKVIQRIDLDHRRFALAITLESPPQFYRKRTDELAGHVAESLQWSEFDTWRRQTDVLYDPEPLETTKIALHKERPVIDIGRWTTYLFVFSRYDTAHVYDTMKQALQDFNIEIVDIPRLNQVHPRAADLWAFIDPIDSDDSNEMQYLNGGEPAMYLPFEVRYQLEVCISREYINEYNVTKEFIQKLSEMASQDPRKARNMLEYVAGQEKRVYEPMKIFQDNEALTFSAKTDIPHYCAYSRKATITPTTMYFSSPTVETTNRVLRHYARENEDGRFLRVQFTDELFEGRINSCANKERNDELYSRVYRTLYNGIQIGDRHYKFLAFGNSQFRENGAYFFCPTDHLSCEDIRQWMGNFSKIKVAAKYAARLGQCFSTTRAINFAFKPEIVQIPDVYLVHRGEKYCSTDGVGKISPYLAHMVAADLGIPSMRTPSAFQFRLGGCKGILTVWPDAKGLHIRESQQKFTATYNGLEIIRCSHFSTATLNRQTITILSSLGVPDKVFLNMLTEQLENYQSAMDNDDLAVSLLVRYVDDNQMTTNIATMIRNGFMAEREPFVLSLLHLWRAWSIKLLKEKAKIIVENGAFVLGCVDETGTLRGHARPTVAVGEKFTKNELPQIFLQIPDKADPNQYKVIQGICLVGRNPSLHPGDVRIVEAVDVEALHHLRDVVVFPLKGERDVPSMCSGGDLDGDDFFVIWDKDLQPREWNCEPMNYIAPAAKERKEPITVIDLMKFFVRYMKNDALPTIAHAHLAQSDYLAGSVKDTKCLELAALHSKAVDYVKTGERAVMPKRLRPGKWPHFMEKRHKPKDAQYHSDKILGQLYDKVETVDFTPQYEERFDKRILRAYSLNDAILKDARQIKTKYDTAMRRLMAQQEVKTEFEIWSTFVLSKPRVGSDYKLQEEIARVSDALKEQFRDICIKKAGSKDFSTLGPFVAAMYKVTKEEMDIALAECRMTKVVAGRDVPRRKMEPKYMPLITFPWLFERELGRIATGIDAYDDLEGLSSLALGDTGHARKRQTGGLPADTDDYIRQEDGSIIHRGEKLDLFHQDADSDSEAQSEDHDVELLESHVFTLGEPGEQVLATEFRPTAVPEHLRSGTGVEDVVPRLALDGFDDLRESHVPFALGSSRFYSNWRQGPDLSVNFEQYAMPAQSPTSSATPPTFTPTSSSPIGEGSANSAGALSEGTGGEEHEREEEEEEEVLVIKTKESPFEKLAKLVAEPTSTHAIDPEETEVVEHVEKESALEKLGRFMES